MAGHGGTHNLRAMEPLSDGMIAAVERAWGRAGLGPPPSQLLVSMWIGRTRYTLSSWGGLESLYKKGVKEFLEEAERLESRVSRTPIRVLDELASSFMDAALTNVHYRRHFAATDRATWDGAAVLAFAATPRPAARVSWRMLGSWLCAAMGTAGGTWAWRLARAMENGLGAAGFSTAQSAWSGSRFGGAWQR